jgi:hypothetical protein
MKTIAISALAALILYSPASARDHANRNFDRSEHRGGSEHHDDRGFHRFDHRHGFDGHRHFFFNGGFYYPFYSGFYGEAYPFYGDDFYVYRGREVYHHRASIEIAVEEALAERGYYRGEIDGIIGPRARTAIRSYQHDHGLPITGRIDRNLFHSLDVG